ncbi:MAG: hypothetical protein EOP60_18580, partial [Sphingomonadales bacterium]
MAHAIGAAPSPEPFVNSVSPPALGLDFGTTNTVAALADGKGDSQLVDFSHDGATGSVFRSALCFWEEERGWN